MSTQISLDENLLHLGIGQPDPQLLPTNLFDKGKLEWSDLAYGEQQGNANFRNELAHWLQRQHQEIIEPDHLFVSNGASNALYLICQQFTQPGDTVLVESPTYFIARTLFEEFKLNVVTVELEEDGVDIEDFQHKLEQYDPKFFYCIPTYHNPTGITYSNAKRRAVCRLAKATDCLVVADEVYQYLYFGQQPPQPLALIDTLAPVLSIHTFSKILAPGLRLGWILSFDRRLQQIYKSALLKSGGGLAPVQSAWVQNLFKRNQFDHYLNDLRETYASRKSVLLEELNDVAESSLQCDGGYFIWMKLPRGLSCDDIHEDCKQAGVDFMQGSLFTDASWAKHYIRLCFALYDESDLKQAAIRLKRIIEDKI